MRMLLTSLRVASLQHAIEYDTDVLGMQLLREKNYPGGRVWLTLPSVGYG